MSAVHTFAGGPLDRASHHRTDADWLAAQLTKPQTRIVPLWRLQPLIGHGSGPGIGWLYPDQLDGYLGSNAPTVFLGLDDGIAHFAIDISAVENPKKEGPFGAIGRFMDLRAVAPQLTLGDPSTLATAKAILDWNARHRFCAVCGHPSEMRQAGYMRKCLNDSCNAEHFPRTDPVVIMLATRADMALVGRQAMFPKGMYSSLAGFVEPGENIEEAVRREIMEEAGIQVSTVRYHSTQPWPWPSSLMIGCFADALSEEITIDGQELEEARWVSRAEVRAAIQGEPGTILLPPPMAIGFQLLRAFAEMN